MAEQDEEQQVAKAFNAGYLLQKYEPELLKKIITPENKENSYVSVIANGQQQQKKDKIISEQQRQAERQQQQKLKPRRQ